MKKIILILLTNLLYVMIANAFVMNNSEMKDTLSKRIVNGLEVIPIKMKTLTYSEYSKVNLWKLHVPGFEESFRNFESRYPGRIGDSVSKEMLEILADWQEDVWNKIIPAEIKVLVGKCSSPDQRKFHIRLYINKEGCVFAVEFIVSDDVLEALNTLPRDMMKDLYCNLLKEKCDVIKQVEFCLYRDEITNQEGKEYITMTWDWFLYNKFGTRHPTKLQKMLEDGTLEKIFNGEKKKK